jgi:hypothetical protein
MITAAQARENVKMSNATLQKYFEKIDRMIEKASCEGKTYVALYGLDELSGSILSYAKIEVTRLQQRIIDELKSIGYSASVVFDGDAYVPRGLQNDDGEGPEYLNVVIHVSWLVKEKGIQIGSL